MKITVGSKNPVKVEAVKEYFPSFEIESVEADSGISEQPKSLEETIKGSRNRCVIDADWSIGIESGIMPVECSSGWMNIVACSFRIDGRFWLGLASGFVVPIPIMDIVFRDNVDLSEAAFRDGLTKDKRVGYKEGIVHILTNGKMDRKSYIKQAIMMAMIQVEHSEMY